MNIIKHHNQKAYMFLSTKGSLVSAFVVVVSHKGKTSESSQYTQVISEAQAHHLVLHRTELATKGIFVTDNRTKHNLDNSNQPILALAGFVTPVVVSTYYKSVVSPYISIFNEVEFFSTQKVRGPNSYTTQF